MSKKGRARRTPEQRDAAKDRRSTIGYLRNLQRQVERELSAPAVTVEDVEKVAAIGETLGIATERATVEFMGQPVLNGKFRHDATPVSETSPNSGEK